jgi:hypothetical protein
MPLTLEDFRRLALSFPETSEASHMSHPDFRVNGKIFATLGYPDDGYGMVKLPPEELKAFVEAEPAIFSPAKGAWGRSGSTSVLLSTANRKSLKRAMAAAWRSASTKTSAKRSQKRRA